MDLLSEIEVLQVDAGAPAVSLETIDFAGQMARQLGAVVYSATTFADDGTFLGRCKGIDEAASKNPRAWARQAVNRFLLVAGGEADSGRYSDVSAVLLNADRLASEATWMAESGIADLLGNPWQAPIIPTGHYAAGTASYGVLAALCALVAKRKRYDAADVAVVDGAGVLAWVNWKAAAAGKLGRDIRREGEGAEWPVVPCADGYGALVFQERDWGPMVRMIGDARLEDEKFKSFKRRAEHRDEYMEIIRAWAARVTKRDLVKLFTEHQIPAAPVMTEADLLEDPLLEHRGSFPAATRKDGRPCRTPALAHRIVDMTASDSTAHTATPSPKDVGLPLAGMRVLDLGIITAGAGVGGLLADLGAEVLKIESQTYPDPFRQWAGEAVSPLFKCNNRNKYGLSIDLKTADGRAAFEALVIDSDLVLENFRRGVLDRLGFDYQTLKALNPRIVLASISGQGLDGPGSEATSFGSTLEASSGFSVNVHYEDGVPYITGRNLNYPDQTVVLYAAAVLTAALMDRRRGMHVDVSQRDVAVYLAGDALEQISAGETLRRQGNGGCHRSADGAWVAVSSEGQISGEPLSTWVAAQDAASAVAELRAQGIPAAEVNAGSKMLEQFENAFQFALSPAGDLVKGFPFQLANTPMTIRLNSPEVGEHTAQFLEEIGL